jgi:periplasmic protein TonB
VARVVEPAAAPDPPQSPKRETARSAPKKIAPAPTVPQPVPAEPITEATTVAQYRQLLITSAVRHNRAASISLESEAEVLLRLDVAAGGVIEVSVKRSSGHGLLDQQALEMFREAAANVVVPPALRGQEFVIEVRAVYALER